MCIRDRFATLAASCPCVNWKGTPTSPRPGYEQKCPPAASDALRRHQACQTRRGADSFVVARREILPRWMSLPSPFM
eukprot:2488134-Alexandrium_andersonii.AAC.2